MSMTITAPVESIVVEKRTWHQDLDVQGFLDALEAGATRDFDNDPLVMKRELAEGILSYIDSKEAFVALVDEYIVNEELDNGYDVYTVDRSQLFTANRELLEDFVKPDWVRSGSGSDSDWIEFLYDSIAYYGIGEIGIEDVNSAFIEDCIEDENEQDAWHMGCYAINNRALHTLMVAYGVHTGKLEIVPPKPTPVAPVTPVAHKNIQLCAVTPHSFDGTSLVFVSDISADNELSDTDVFIGEQTQKEFMLNIKGEDIEAFKQEFHALMTKYHA